MAETRIARIFPRQTKFTPTDPLAFVGPPPIDPPEVDEVHVSVAFTWDLSRAERLAHLWQRVGPVKIGGPATGQRGEDFEPGKYLKSGIVITSRGCPNKCWFCQVWRREGGLREFPIMDGWIVQDDNLLACSEQHIRDVFTMLRRQPHRPSFPGGLEAAQLQEWHVALFRDARTEQMFFAYDTPDDYPPLVRAAGLLNDAGFNRHQMRCYVLIGHPNDTQSDAEERMNRVKDLGFAPFAMLYRDESGKVDSAWKPFQHEWCRPAAIYTKAVDPP